MDGPVTSELTVALLTYHFAKLRHRSLHSLNAEVKGAEGAKFGAGNRARWCPDGCVGTRTAQASVRLPSLYCYSNMPQATLSGHHSAVLHVRYVAVHHGRLPWLPRRLRGRRALQEIHNIQITAQPSTRAARQSHTYLKAGVCDSSGRSTCTRSCCSREARSSSARVSRMYPSPAIRPCQHPSRETSYCVCRCVIEGSASRQHAKQQYSGHNREHTNGEGALESGGARVGQACNQHLGCAVNARLHLPRGHQLRQLAL